MKFEVGKCYKTKNGEKAIVYAIYQHADGNYMHGAYKHEHNSVWTACTWDECGMTFISHSRLIEEWVDKPKIDRNILPIWHKWVAMDQDGKWFSYTDKPTFHTYGIWRGNNSLKIPSEYYPKWEGTPKHSLIELDNQTV
jgi:hypothetical protein